MPRISLTDLLDVVSASGTPKMTKVSNIKNRKPYEPAFDFYKPLRDMFVEIHQNSSPRTSLGAILGKVQDEKKLSAYPQIIGGYRKWWGRKSLVWYDPPIGSFSRHGVEVSVNPELGLEIDGTCHLVKLYFKADKLSRNRIEVITHLMKTTLGTQCSQGTIMSVLDIRRANLFSPTVPIPKMSAVLEAELAYIATLWPAL